MTKLATMGASSCGTIAIQGFKNEDIVLEQEYLKTGEFNEPEENVQWFYDEVLYPTDQDLGRTADYPFTLLMDRIDQSGMCSKFIIAVLAEFQLMEWEDKLKARGFEQMDKTYNEIGCWNFIFVRNLNRYYEEEEDEDFC